LDNYKQILAFIRQLYNEPSDPIPLHAPVFRGNEKKYLNDCIDSTFVSYVGKYVSKFEEMTAAYLGVKNAVAVVNGTAGLQIALQIAGVKRGDLVLTQALTFVATANAIVHAGGEPVFIDSEKENLGMSTEKLNDFLKDQCHFSLGSNGRQELIHTTSKCRIAACVPVHIFGHPVKIEEILNICNNYHIVVVEDAAEAIGSTFNGRYMGTFGLLGVLSYNGNKTITTGGGGMIITNDNELAGRAKHLTSTAKIPHAYEFYHDETAYNYRLTNIQAAIGCAQMEQITQVLLAKRELALKYEAFFRKMNISFFTEPQGCQSNYWLNALLFDNRNQRNAFLEYANANNVLARPAWTLMNKLPMYKKCKKTSLENAEWLEDRIVNLPSGVRSCNNF
jgi:perosamine synthetase